MHNPKTMRPTMRKLFSPILLLALLLAGPAPAQQLGATPQLHVPAIVAVYHTALGQSTPTWATVTGSTSVLTPILDAAAAGVLSIAPTTATSILLGQNTSMTGAATFGTGTGAVAINGAVTFAANKGIVATAGTGAFDFSLGTGIFKTSTGAVTIGNGAVSVTGATTFSAAVSTSGSNAVALATGTAATTISSTAATAGAGLRNASTRNIVRASSVAPPDCAGAGLSLTVTQFLDAGIATCGTAQTVTFPTWQTGSGIVQGLPGTPAVGDVVEFLVVASAGNAVTVACGTGGTCGGSTTVPANTDKLYRCRITAVTGGAETATCY